MCWHQLASGLCAILGLGSTKRDLHGWGRTRKRPVTGGLGTELSAQRKPVPSPAVPSDIEPAGTWGRCAGHSSAQMQPPGVTGTEVITGVDPVGWACRAERKRG